MPEDPFAQGMALVAEARQLRQSDVLGATAKAYQALHLFQTVPTRRGMGLAHLLLGEFALFSAELVESRDHLTAARDLFAEIPLRGMEAQARRLLGDVFIRFDDFDAARAELRRAMEILSNSGDATGRAEVHRRLGSLERRCGDLEQALTHYRTAMDAYLDLGDSEGLAGVLLSLGNTLAGGQDPEAIKVYAEAIRLFGETGDRLGQANAERFYAASARRLGHGGPALDFYRRALDGYTEVGDLLGESHVRQALGELAAESGDTETSRQELQLSIHLFARICDPISLVGVVNSLADSHLVTGDEVTALHTLTWGVAEARQAARWAVSEPRREHTDDLIADAEARALALAVKLDEGIQTGKVSVAGVARLADLLPLMADSEGSSDPQTEALRQRISSLAGRAETSAPSELERPPGGPGALEEDDPGEASDETEC